MAEARRPSSDSDITARVAALAGRASKSPSHVENLRSAVVRELEDWREDLVIAPMNLLNAVERYDEAKGSSRGCSTPQVADGGPLAEPEPHPSLTRTSPRGEGSA